MALNTHTLNDIMDSTKRQFGDESGVQITEDDITRWANQATMEINSKNKVLRASAEVPISGITSKISTPDDCMVPIRVLYINDDKQQSIKLVGIGLDDFIDKYPNLRYSTGVPINWSISMEDIMVGPAVDGLENPSAIFEVYYVPEPEKMEVGADRIPLPDRYFDRIVEYVMSKAYELDENWQGHSIQRQLFEDSLTDRKSVV